jgi:hypothetical protein
MTVSTANHVFLPWVRQGAAAGIQTIDTLNDTPAGVVSVPVKLRVNNSNEIERKVRLYGPGDVIGIDPLQVIRTEPRNLATDFEPTTLLQSNLIARTFSGCSRQQRPTLRTGCARGCVLLSFASRKA